MFVFHRLGGSFLRIWCSQTDRKFSIGIFITFSEPGRVFTSSIKETGLEIIAQATEEGEIW